MGVVIDARLVADWRGGVATRRARFVLLHRAAIRHTGAGRDVTRGGRGRDVTRGGRGRDVTRGRARRAAGRRGRGRSAELHRVLRGLLGESLLPCICTHICMRHIAI